jgi:hypothetical protein
MSVRKMLMVCVVAMAAILPLVGCSVKVDSGGTGDGAGSDTSNTTSSTE